jgi:hypothetical protein
MDLHHKATLPDLASHRDNLNAAEGAVPGSRSGRWHWKIGSNYRGPGSKFSEKLPHVEAAGRDADVGSDVDQKHDRADPHHLR